MAAAKHFVIIKGVKDGLVFILDDQCEFAALTKELQYKLEKTHQQILSGPMIHVHVKLGKRMLNDQQKEIIRGLIKQRGNLLLQSIESEPGLQESRISQKEQLKVAAGIVRSGQTLHFHGNILYLGDVNPGGTITSTGDIYIMGSLKGMAHAGIDGNEGAIIAASHFRPTQLRISGVISRPPDEWGVGETFMEYAFLDDGTMQIDKINHLHRLRPESVQFKRS